MVGSRQNLCYLMWEGLNTARVIAQGKPGKIECQHIARKSGLTSPVGWFGLGCPETMAGTEKMERNQSLLRSQ